MWPRGWVQLYSSMTAALEGGEWSAARPGRTLPPGKTRYPFYRRLGGPQGQSRWAENVVPTGIRSQTVQPIVSCYTNWATGHTLCMKYCIKITTTNTMTMQDFEVLSNKFYIYRICTSVILNWMRKTGIYAAGKKSLRILIGTAY